MSPEEVRAIILEAMQYKLASTVIDGDDVATSRAKIALEVVRRFDEDQIDNILVEMFKELTAQHGG